MAMTARSCAILPLKPFSDAKERLATGLDQATRCRIAEAMARDVLAALGDCDSLDEVVIISAEPAIEQIAATATGNDGVPLVSAVIADDLSGHNAAAASGVRWAIEAECDMAVLIPGDCPLLDPTELDELVAMCRFEDVAVAVVPDRMGTGTNALVLTPCDVIGPAFGPGSLDRHLHVAGALGVDARVVEVESLALDLDTTDDLIELAHRIGTGEHFALNTEQVVAELSTNRYRLPGGMGR